MKIYSLHLLLLVLLAAACVPDLDIDNTGPFNPDEIIEDNIFGCSSFVEMPTEESFFVNTPIHLETLGEYFVYATTDKLIIHEGFNGPIVQQLELVTEGIVRHENQLVICAEEGLFLLDHEGALTQITDARCKSITVDGVGRLLTQGTYGPGNLRTSYDIHELKNSTLTTFARLPAQLNCVSLDLFGSIDGGLYAQSCDQQLAYYEDGVLQRLYQPGEAPFTKRDRSSGSPMPWAAYESDPILTDQTPFGYLRMYRFTQGEWTLLYDLDYSNPGDYGKEWGALSIRYNPFIHEDHLYNFATNTLEAIIRFEIDGTAEKTLDNIQLVNLPGLPAKEITGIVTASDGHTYVVMSQQKIVRISC